MKRPLIATLLALAALSATAQEPIRDSFEQSVQRLAEEIRLLREELAKAHQAPAPLAARTEAFEINAAAGTMKLGGYGQFDGRAFEGGHPGDSAFLVRRLRADLRGTLRGDVGYRLQGDFAGSSARLVEGWMDLRLHPGAKATVGQFKEPFSMEEMQSAAWLDFIERSMIVTAFAPQEDIGAGLSGALLDQRIEYHLGAFNGRGKNVEENNSDKDIAGRLVVAPWTPSDKARLGQLYLGVNATTGEQDEDLKDTAYRTAARTKFLGYAADAKADGVRERVGGDFEWFFGPVGVKGEWMQIDQDNVYLGSTNANATFDGWYVSGVWVLTGEDLARGKSLVPRTEAGHGGWGAWALEGRFEEFNADRGLLDTGLAIGTDQAQAGTVGVTWYPNANVKVMGNLIHVDFDDTIKVDGQKIDNEDVALVRLQYSL